MADCKKYLVVGTSGLDPDLTMLLSECVPDPSTIHYVAGADVQQVRDRFENGVPQFRVPSSVPYAANAGFRAYLSSDEFADFVRR